MEDELQLYDLKKVDTTLGNLYGVDEKTRAAQTLYVASLLDKNSKSTLVNPLYYEMYRAQLRVCAMIDGDVQSLYTELKLYRNFVEKNIDTIDMEGYYSLFPNTPDELTYCLYCEPPSQANEYKNPAKFISAATVFLTMLDYAFSDQEKGLPLPPPSMTAVSVVSILPEEDEDRRAKALNNREQNKITKLTRFKQNKKKPSHIKKRSKNIKDDEILTDAKPTRNDGNYHNDLCKVIGKLETITIDYQESLPPLELE